MNASSARWAVWERVPALLSAVLAALASSPVAMNLALAQDSVTAQRTLQTDGTIRVPAFELPISSFFTPEARDAFRQRLQWIDDVVRSCPFRWDTVEAARASRQCRDEKSSVLLAKQKTRYSVHIQPETMGGVYTEVFTPAGGVSPENRHRVLINLRGSAFAVGTRMDGQIESIPIAGVGKIKVVSVDYRMAPEYHFPAASEDVAVVYRMLLKSYKPENIGIYGCSAGGVLTSQAVSWFQKEGLPRPGAVGMFCGAASYWSEGDMGYVGVALMGHAPVVRSSEQPAFDGNPYFKGTDPQDPLAFPVTAPKVLAKFPPSLLITGTRAIDLSSVVHTHAELVKQDVEAQLNVWEGLDHAFFFDPDLPQSRDMYAVTVKFFAKHLGK